MKIAALALVLPCLLVAAAAHAQEPPAAEPQATFRSSVDLVPVDVSVVDKTGLPIRGLEAGDFRLTIDGRPRTIQSAQFISSSEAVGPLGAPVHYSSNSAAVGGRLVMMVVDQGNIGAGRGKLVLDAASRFVGQLSPADRVGLVAIPGAGPQINFTSNHAAVQLMLPRLVGHAQNAGGEFRVGIAEALAIERNDTATLDEIFARECTSYRTVQEIEDCKRRIANQATVVYAQARERTRNSLIALRSLLDRLAQTPSPKTVVFFSEGLLLERDTADVTWLPASAARGQISLYVVQMDAVPYDAASSRFSPSRTGDIQLAEEGLGIVAGMARGTVLRSGATGEAALSRLSREISAFYLLSFAPEPGDRDGRPHKIKIEVPGRRGMDIRSRSEFAVAVDKSLTDEEAIVDTLRAPLLSTDVGLRVSTYALHDATTDKPRVLVAAEIDRASTDAADVALGFVIVNQRGEAAATQVVPKVDAPVRRPGSVQTFTGSVVLAEPGPHTLKLAVVDSTGKRGSVERAFTVAPTAIGQVRASELLLAENLVEAGGLVPAVAGRLSTPTLHAYLEVWSVAAAALDPVEVTFEVAASEEGQALESVEATANASSVPNRRAVEGALSVALLPPGDYVARAVVKVNGRAVTTIRRPFSIDRTVGGSATTVASVPSRGAVPFTSRIDTFERSAVLTPQVVGFFLDRMNVGATGPSSAAPAIEQARAGRFEEAVAALPAAGDRVAAAFLGGLALYSKGDLEGAAGKFRDTLRLDSEFFPAAFYLGSCYAAGGRDTEAVGAWQTSLVTESDAPFIYTLLGDALLRLSETADAVTILDEASTLWPGNDEVQLRLGTAYSMAGQPAAALGVLEPYLTRHPDDQERRFVLLRTLYEARAAGTPVRGVVEDKALFDGEAEKYVAAKGAQQPLIEQWQKFFNRR